MLPVVVFEGTLLVALRVMKRIGLLGGTFDPPHLGHLVVAEGVRDAMGLDEVRLLVAGDPWMKRTTSTAGDRVRMCELAVAGDAHLAVDDREVHRAGPTYTADTLHELRATEPDVDWTFVLGADAAARLPEWDRVHEALDLARWVVVGRPGTSWPDHELADRLTRVEVPLIGVSSTDLRERAAAGRSLRYLVPDAVRDHVRRQRLYVPVDD